MLLLCSEILNGFSSWSTKQYPCTHTRPSSLSLSLSLLPTPFCSFSSRHISLLPVLRLFQILSIPGLCIFYPSPRNAFTPRAHSSPSVFAQVNVLMRSSMTTLLKLHYYFILIPNSIFSLFSPEH